MGDLGETICALATAPGRAGIAVIRMSGSESFRLIRNLISPADGVEPLQARRALLARILDPVTGEELDQALVTCFPSPHSYTGEDTVEISLHGSPVVISAVLNSLCDAGARLAEPGEFTMRGFLHGRMDLAQAEAVRDVIESTTLYQARVAARQRSGALSRRLEPFKRFLTEIIVTLESALEFVEEDLPLESRGATALKLEEACREIGSLVENARRGRVVRDGFSMAIVGKTNAGKSSLFNALLADERSIVTPQPGTTRDLVSEFTNLGGIPLRLVDTAGIRHSEDILEQMGVERSYRAIADADVVLFVIDTSCELAGEDARLRDCLGDVSCIVVLNKSDLPSCWSAADVEDFVGACQRVSVSALTGTGIDELRTLILKHLVGDDGTSREGILVTNLRHSRSLEGAGKHLSLASEALRKGMSEEFVLHDLHSALRKLGEITGETSVEDLLGEIFSRFCIGK
jgi:tRNA modification GTPase